MHHFTTIKQNEGKGLKTTRTCTNAQTSACRPARPGTHLTAKQEKE